MEQIPLNAVGVGGRRWDYGHAHLVAEMTRIYWLSRHAPLPAQIEELRRIFGEVELVEDRRPFGDTADILARYRASGCTEILVVVPESILRRLVDACARPLKAKMREVDRLTDDRRETVAKNQVWRFVEFERVVRYEFVTEALDARQKPQPE